MIVIKTSTSTAKGSNNSGRRCQRIYEKPVAPSVLPNLVNVPLKGAAEKLKEWAGSDSDKDVSFSAWNTRN